ncbi:MAG TPA: NAD(P)H-hydrate dehydratase [Planctomycetota bacterium]|nr:NAD(P)H-hydrate dehydratase [Planctomycetota bacterium]
MRPQLIPYAEIPNLPAREHDANKGDCGRIAVIGGSRGMAGAPCLAAKAAYRSGAGLVLVAVPKSIWDVVASKLDEAQTRGVGGDSAQFFQESDVNELKKICEWADVLVMGPGMTQSAETVKAVQKIVESCECPMVLDADALNAFGRGRAELIFASQKKNTRREVVLTPHPGEMARLLNMSTADVQSDRPQAALACADLTSAVVVLKGAGTLVCDGKYIFLNRTGNPGMATGGTGDVLSGVIGGLMGQGMPAFEAACLGVHLHGLAGDIAAEKRGMWSLIAGDLIDELPAAFLRRVGT